MDLEHTQLTPDVFSRFKPYFQGQKHALCAYSLATIIVWTSEEFYKSFGVIRDDALVVFSEYYRTPEKRHLILPLAPGRDFTPKELAEISGETGYDNYWFVPEDYIRQAGKGALEEFFHVKRHPELDDYVYNTHDLALLKGNKYSKKRNLINQFEREYVQNGQVEVLPISPEDVSECVDFMDQWCLERDCCYEEDDDLMCERRAAILALENLEILEARGLLCRIKGNICAFGVGSTITSKMGSLNFEKALPSIKGLYQFFDRECALRIFDGFSFINKESDMGEPGLAQAKKSYHPIKIVKSFKLIRKT